MRFWSGFATEKSIRNVFEGLVKQEQLILICIRFKTTSELHFYVWGGICQTNKTLIFSFFLFFFPGNNDRLKIANIWQSTATDVGFAFENKQFIWPLNEMLQHVQTEKHWTVKKNNKQGKSLEKKGKVNALIPSKKPRIKRRERALDAAL